MKLSTVPIYALETDPELKHMMRALVRQGRAARQMGIRRTQVPPFVDPLKRAAWQYGWRWENEAIRKKDRADKPHDLGWIGKGRKARQATLSIRQYPRYVTVEQKRAWRYGWRQENECIIKRNLRDGQR